jgi:hypothetical protein
LTPVALAGQALEVKASSTVILPRTYLMTPNFCSLPAASVTPSRRTEHVGNEFLRHLQLIARRRSSDGSSQRHGCCSASGADCHRSLRHLRDQRLRVTQQHMQHRHGG